MGWACFFAAPTQSRAQDAGQAPEGVREYTAYRASPGLSIDGRLNEAAWEAAPWTESFVDIRGEDHPTPTWETGAKVLWDDEFLYFAAWLDEPHLWGTLTERDAIIYRDNDIEVFIDPEGDGVSYYEFEVNVLGTMFDLYLDRPYNQGGSANIAWDAEGLRWGVWTDGTVNDPTDEDRGWSFEMAVPWSALVPPGSDGSRAAPGDGDVWRVNFSRVQWPHRIEGGGYVKLREPVDWSDHPEDNWVWSPQGAINMHIPSMWGAVTFRAAPPPGSHE